MSQAQQQTDVGAAFSTPPYNIFKQQADANRVAAAQAAAEVSQGVAPQPQPEPQAATPPVEPAVEQSYAPQPQPYVPPQDEYRRDPRDEEMLQRMYAERETAMQHMEAMRQELAKTQQELDALRQQAFAGSVDMSAFQNLQSLDPEDAKVIAQTAASAAYRPIEAMRQDMERQRQEFAAVQRRQHEEFRRARQQQLTQEVLRAHPDYYNIYRTPDFVAYMRGRDGLSSKTRDERAGEEFEAGNTAYVIDLLNRYKASRPNIQQAVSVAPVQSASSVSSPAPSEPAAPQMSLRELNDLFQMRQITPEAYREQLAKLRAAQLP